MSTAAQIAANQKNAQLSSGPTSEIGKAVSALNNFRHGFTGAFCILDWEKHDEYDLLYGGLLDDHQPANTTERLLVKTMAQSYWLRERALNLQQMCFRSEAPMCDPGQEKQLALYLRYQTTHDRAFNKALDQLLKLRAEKKKQEIGFESQERKRKEEERKRVEEERKRKEEARKEAEQKAAAQRREAQEKRREAAAHRAAELHQARVWLTEAQANRHETETTIAQVLKMPRAKQDHAKSA